MLLIVCQIFVLLLLMFRKKILLSQVGTALLLSVCKAPREGKGEGQQLLPKMLQTVVTNENVFDVNIM